MDKPVAPEFTLAQINAAVTAMVKAQDRSVTAIGKVLVMAVYASIVGIEKDHVAVATMVTKNLRKSVKSTAVITFLETYGKLAYLKGEWQFFNVGAQKALVWDAEYSAKVQAAALTWESLRAEPVEQSFDVEAKIRTIIADAAKRQKAGKKVENAELLAELPAVLATFSSKKALIGG
jgi:hypothetical protein